MTSYCLFTARGTASGGFTITDGVCTMALLDTTSTEYATLAAEVRINVSCLEFACGIWMCHCREKSTRTANDSASTAHDSIPTAHDTAHDSIPTAHDTAHDSISTAHDFIPSTHNSITTAHDCIPIRHTILLLQHTVLSLQHTVISLQHMIRSRSTAHDFTTTAYDSITTFHCLLCFSPLPDHSRVSGDETSTDEHDRL